MKYTENSFDRLETLNEEEQMQHIYSPRSSTRINSSEPTSNKDEIISQSSTLSFETDHVLNRQWQQIKCYVCFKAMIWLFLGCIIFWANYNKQDNLTASINDDNEILISDAQKWCCECHNWATKKLEKKLSPRRIDWSYCDGCFNCTSCILSPHDINQSFHTEQCTGINGIHYGHSSEEVECHLPKHILSHTTMKIFMKNYHAYGWGALITCLIYVGITMMVFVVDNTKHHVDSIGMLLMVYNIVVAIVCFYMVYKPNQYQKQFIPAKILNTTVYDDTGEKPYCYVDTLGHNMEDALSVFIFGSLMLMFLQWLFCCCKCAIKRRRKENLNCLTSFSERIYIFVTVLCGIGFFITMFTAVGYLCYYVYNHDVSFTIEIIWLFVVDSMLVLSCVDIFCCPFCCKRVNDCCEARNIRIKYQKKKYNNQLHKQTLLTAQDLDDVDDNIY